MESMDVAGVLQEAGDAGSRAYTRSQVYVEYFIILYTSTSINVHLSQGCHDHGVATANDAGDGANECDWFILGFRWENRRGGYNNFSVFGLFLIAFWWLVMVAVFVSLLLFLSLICLIRCYMETIVLCKNISTAQIWSLLCGFLHFTSQLDF